MHIEKVLSYYQDCYKQEFRDNDILNFLGNKVDKRFFLKEIDGLYRETDTPLMTTDFGDELYKYLEIHKKEKTFIACSFFVTGKLTFLGRKRTICAPLMVTPVTININDQALYHLEYNFSENRSNDALLNLFKKNFDLDDSFVLEMKALINDQDFASQDVSAICKKLKAHIDIDVKSMKGLPTLMPGDLIRSHANSAKLRLLPVIALGIVEKSKSSRDVLHEIDVIKEGHLYNDTLQHFFSRRKPEIKSEKDTTHEIYVPSNLSQAQLDIIHAAKSNDLSVVIGPPGTGKSYTIASLAIDQIYHNKSVLICSKSDQAVDVLQHKIINDLGVKGLSIRAGSGRGHRAKLRKKIQSITRFRKAGGDYYIPKKQKEIDYAQSKIQEINEEIKERERKEIKNAELFLDHNPSFFKRLKRNYVSRKVLKEYPFWELIDLLQHYIHQKNRLIKEIISLQYQHRVADLLARDRTFPELLKLIATKDAAERESLFQSIDFSSVLQCLPIWITKSTDVSDVFPLENDIFDMVIIDEASQCDIATMIPVLARAKKVVVVGDPKQLRHVSFLSKHIMEKTAETHGVLQNIDVFNYRETSFLDYAMERLPNPGSIHFLDEHYRSVPDIIRYSNQKFYFDKLLVMSDLQIHHKSPAIHWIFCKGEKQKDGVNQLEAHKILEDILKTIEKEESVAPEASSSIGILSPFRDQVNYLKNKIQELDLSAIKKHKIAVGTPFEFQGEERDQMFITFTIDNNTSPSVFQYLDREDVFNVSITRAKQKQYLYYSFEAKNFKNKHLLIDYQSETKIKYTKSSESDYQDKFANEVHEELIQLGIAEEDILINYQLAGYIKDILLTHNGKTICIDLVGYPGTLEKSFSVDQYRTLFRTNIPIITIPYSYWLFNKEACLHQIAKKVRIKR